MQLENQKLQKAYGKKLKVNKKLGFVPSLF
jgi:hypothetical protein